MDDWIVTMTIPQFWRSEYDAGHIEVNRETFERLLGDLETVGASLEKLTLNAVRDERERVCHILLTGKAMRARAFWVASEAVGAILPAPERAEPATVATVACDECCDWFDNPLNRGRVTAESPECPVQRAICVRFAPARAAEEPT